MKNVIMLIVSFILIGCADNMDEIGECAALLSPVSYSAQVYPIISNTCAVPQCHIHDFQYGNFTQFEEIKKRADNGKLEFMIETHQMPHGFTDGPSYLTSCEVETIKKWIAEGANNN